MEVPRYNDSVDIHFSNLDRTLSLSKPCLFFIFFLLFYVPAVSCTRPVCALLKFVVAAQQHRFLVIVLRNRGDTLVRGVSPLRWWYRHVLRIVRIEAGYSHTTLSFRAP